MKILWITSSLFPEVCDELKIPHTVTTGWLYASAMSILKRDTKIELSVASFYSGNKLQIIDKFRIRYYLIPNYGNYINYNKQLEKDYIFIKNDFKPNLVHLHGSEYPHSLAWVKACGTKNVVVSIQGLVSVYSKQYLGGIDKHILKNNITIRDIIRNDNLFLQKRNMEKRGLYEKELLSKCENLIGRTSWDKSHVWALNSTAKYYFCNETLRESFYTQNWNIDNCDEHTIFLSQAHYPIKGLHQVIKVLPIVLKHFPKTKVKVAGVNFFDAPFYRINGFANYIKKLMKEYGVADKFTFLGIIDEYEMLNQYLSANVFVCPSAIENSPNSVGEAQTVGTPCIASYVGGTMDMIEEGKTGLMYRFEEIEMLAEKICTVFSNRELTISISKNSIIEAGKRHNEKTNAERLIQIYNTIVE